MKPIDQLTDDELRVKVAESANVMGLSVCRACWNFVDGQCCWCGDAIESHSGYEGHSAVPMGCRCGYAEQPQPKSVPDYPADLNACADFERGLALSDQVSYTLWIMNIVNPNGATPFQMMTATARQRCIAFLSIRS